MSFIQIKYDALKRGSLCDHCLGRLVSLAFKGHPVEKVGAALRKADSDEAISGNLSKELEILESKDCFVCRGLFLKKGIAEELVLDKMKEQEFKTFLMGCILPKGVQDAEESLWSIVGCEHCEPIKREINRSVGKNLEKKSGKKVDFDNPDIIFTVDFENNRVSKQISSVFIFGKYRKLIRGIPQTKWPCRECNGKGCNRCGNTGKMYQETVEELIAEKAIKETRAVASKFHGCISPSSAVLLEDGRSLMLGDLVKKKGARVLSHGSGFHGSDVVDYFAFNPSKSGVSTYSIVTKETGRRLVASGDHVLYTKEGKTPVFLIKEGSRVVVNPQPPVFKDELPSRVIVSEEDVMKVINRHFPSSHSNRHLKSLKEKGLLPLFLDDPRTLSMVRLLAFIFGDATARYSRGRDVSLEFYGKERDLLQIKKDIECLGFDANINIRTKDTCSKVKKCDGSEIVIKGSGDVRLLCYSKPLWLLLVCLGAPLGDKIINKVSVPRWLMNAPVSIKREFLASIFGAEMSKPRIDDRKHNRKSFNSPIFSVNKSSKLIDNGIKFMNDLRRLAYEFGVETYEPKLTPYVMRKDGHSTEKIRLDFLNRYDNLINLYGKVGFRYCHERQIMCSYAYEYLKMKEAEVLARKKVLEQALKLVKLRGASVAEASKKLGSKHFNRQHLWSYLSGNFSPRNTKVSNSFPDFNTWLETATEGLEEGLLWETVAAIKPVKCSKLMDITVSSPSHNFFANGFLVSNSGREDIDALMLGDGRPFVLELVAPKKRDVDLKKLEKAINAFAKGKVEVSSLRLSNMKEVRDIKSAESEKVYECIVECKGVTKEDIAKIEKAFFNAPLSQRTPVRVSHRRADKCRKKKIYSVSASLVEEGVFKAVIKASSGTYVKELISGDEGRTKPSFSEAIGKKCVCEKLDVLEVCE